MKIFDELENKKVYENENKISVFWDEIGILNKTIENRKDAKDFVFYDGPATANGMPGLHHMLAKLLKDSVCKYKTMNGYRVIRKAGWDTHGLPVELEVEKSLGFTSKTDIEKYGIEAFNKKCKESVFKNENAFRDYTKKMGQFIDLDNAYVTYDNKYIETEWWILNQMFKEGLIYEGHRIIPYCPRCGTGLASHEVAQGYQMVTTETVIVPMKIVSEDAYFLVWTTTPWTLLANVALCVNPNEKYVKVNSKGFNFILANSLVNKVLGDDYTVISEYKGSELEYLEYEQLLPFVSVNKKAFYVTCADFVTMEDGTGIVHIAPAFGEDDYKVGRKYDLPVLQPVGEDGKYTEGPWTGTFVMDVNLDVIKYLKENDKLFKKQKIEHNYPHCWRCKTPLLYYAKPSWYINVTSYKDLMVSENNKADWYPSYIGEKRFGNWLENLNDWAISRSRYWGTPLNIWRCECGHIDSVGSIEELVNKSIEKIDNTIELHRPYVDDIHIKCTKCDGVMSRVPEVIDCWFDSGAMPFAQYHYPFENKDLFENQFPADFICEGVDQTRGWFYSLLAISTFVMKKAPFKNVLVNDMILDKDGQKMSKSRGNALDPFKMFEEYGADALRWYLLYASPVWNPTKFDIDGLKEVFSKFFNTFKNTYNFFGLYANADGIDPRTFEVPFNERSEIDKWLLSRYNNLVKSVTEEMERYDLNKSVRMIQDFINEDLSNWYIRRNRRRFWSGELDTDKKAVYKTTYEVLEGLTRLVAPFIPFLAEEMYQKLSGNVSVHLSDYPTYDLEAINAPLEAKMELVRELIGLGRFAREEAKIKVRQPLSMAIIDGKYESAIGDAITLIAEELNIKSVVYEKDLSKFMNITVAPNFKEAGKVVGSKMKLFQEKLLSLSDDDRNTIESGSSISMELDGELFDITKDLITLKITSKEGFNAQMFNNNFIILNTHLTPELINEGLSREFVSKVQQLRKANNYEMLDRIDIYYDGNETFETSFKSFEEFIKSETLADNIIKKENIIDKYELNDYTVGIELLKK